MTIDHTDEDVLRDLYWEKGLTMREIADKSDVLHPAIQKQMVKNGIERRDAAPRKGAYSNIHPGVHEGSKGYMKIYHQDVDGKAKQLRVHRLIAVAIYGIDAVKDKIVHHKSGHGLDNRHENLELMTLKEHGKHHAEQRANS